MSTKIWVAYRIPKERLIEFTDVVHDSMFASAVHITRTFMKALDETTLKKAIENKELRLTTELERLTDKRKNEFARFEWVVEKAKKASQSMARDWFCLDCGFNVWFDDKYAYIIPISSIEEYKVPEWAEDFHYQNQVDQPEDISDEKWGNRADKWGELCLGTGKQSHNARRFHHEVINLCPPNHIPSEIDLQVAIFPNK